MIYRIIEFSVKNKLIILFGVFALAIAGAASFQKIPLDAVPDITNNQVQIVSVNPALAPEEMEQLVSYPIEAAMTNIPDVTEVRSISRYGLSVVTVVFKDRVPTMLARQYVREQVDVARMEIPQGLVEPSLMPITTGLGEIYQYVLTVDRDKQHLYDNTDLRTIQDWIIKRQLNGTPGIIDVSSFGGFLKQYEISVDPSALRASNMSINDVVNAIEKNNANSGGSYIERDAYALYIRTQGRTETIQSLEQIHLATHNGIPISISDVADVRIGSAVRFGAMTMDGRGEVVGGITLMLKGANSSEALKNVRDRIETIKPALPEGIDILPYLDRSELISETVHTAWTNLAEGGMIVVLVLLLLLGNLRAGLIVASVIPLSMLFAFIMMRIFNISANLMSLGAIDFGIIVDGAVIIVESLLHILAMGYVGKRLTQKEMDNVVIQSTGGIYRSAAFGILIILVVFIPILTLQGIEGKTFRPMAQTFGFAILGSLILALTYVPVMASLALSKSQRKTWTFSDKIIQSLQRAYDPALRAVLGAPRLSLLAAIALFGISVMVFSRLGAEFVPTLEEGDLAMQQTIKPGSSLSESIRTATRAESILLKEFPEVEHVVSKIGTAEIPTDPMAVEDADIMIILKDKRDWVSAKTREELIQKMKSALAPISWANYEFTQPIQLRFNELMTGAKTDIAVKLFGENTDTLRTYAQRAATLIEPISGADDVRIDQTSGLRQIQIQYKREKLRQFGINVSDVNDVIRAAYAGQTAGQILEDERSFEISVRLRPEFRTDVHLERLFVRDQDGHLHPVSTVAEVSEVTGPSMISREQAKRFINIGVNVRNRDVQTLVSEIDRKLTEDLRLPAGYTVQYGGQFENLQAAKRRLLIAVPAALFLILFLLYLAFGSIPDALIIFTAVPMSAIGGIFALLIRDMPFSISSGIGFIALFGVSVLNGIVLVNAIKQSQHRDSGSLTERLREVCKSRLRPVLMTALVAALGFLPMALSTGNGAEVQRPLATVVIGGLITSTLLTLLVLPALYSLVKTRIQTRAAAALVLLFFALPSQSDAQQVWTFDSLLNYAVVNNPVMQNLDLQVEKSIRDLDAVGQWAPLHILYNGGNLNTGAYDNWFEVRQDFGHLLNTKARRKTVQAGTDVVRAENEISRDGFAYGLRRLYIDAQYSQAKADLWNAVYSSYADMLPVLRAQVRAGIVDSVTYSLANSEFLAIAHQQASEQNSANASILNLRTMAYLPDSIQLSIAPLAEIAYDSVQATLSRSNVAQAFEARQKALISEAELQKQLASNPGFSFGALTQSIDGDYGFYALTAGISIPIDRRTSKARMDQIEIEESIIDNQSRQFDYAYDSRRRILLQNLDVIETSLNRYDEGFLSNNQRNNRILDTQLREGSIDFIRYQQVKQSYLRTEIAFIELLRDQNKAALDLMYFKPDRP